jgi:E3 ubiquitin-protein ligase NRDP1
MGFDIQRFPNSIDEELICIFFVFSKSKKQNISSGSICGGVLQDPLQAPSCEHTFCQVNIL